jgi:hypothetical protein
VECQPELYALHRDRQFHMITTGAGKMTLWIGITAGCPESVP